MLGTLIDYLIQTSNINMKDVKHETESKVYP